MPRRNIGKLCSAVNCNNRDATGVVVDGKKVRFHRFPNDASISKKWAVNSRSASLDTLKHEQLRKRIMWSVHFEDYCYVRPSDRDKATCFLRWDAIPTIFNVPNPPSPFTPKRKLPKVRLNKVSLKSKKGDKITCKLPESTVVKKSSKHRVDHIRMYYRKKWASCTQKFQN